MRQGMGFPALARKGHALVFDGLAWALSFALVRNVDLTATRIPVATGPATLGDSNIADGVTGGVATIAGALGANRTKTLQNTTATLAELETAQTWTLSQTFTSNAVFNGAESISCGAAATAGNGLVQLASGTTKASGIAFGTDTFLYRTASGALRSDANIGIGGGAFNAGGYNDLTINGGVNGSILRAVGTGYDFRFQAASGSTQIGSFDTSVVQFFYNGAEVWRNNGAFQLAEGKNIVSGTTTGTQIATSTTQKLGFWSATPVVQQTGYGTPTGAALLTNFPGATATLAQTSGALADLLAKLKSMGLIGA